MNKLQIHLRNCYGIGSLDKEIDLSKGSCIIYAPNGTMKSSLTRVFQDITKGVDSNDRIYTERMSERKVKVDGIDLEASSIYIFQNENADGEKSVSNFLSCPKLKEQYDAIHNELSIARKNLNKSLKKISGSSNIESEVLDSFRTNKKDNVYDCLFSLKDKVLGDSYPIYSFKFNDVFDKNGYVKTFLYENSRIVTKYFEKYNDLLEKSTFFSGGVNSFGTTQAEKLIASVKDNRFFRAKHTLVLSDGSELKEKDSLESRIEKEISAIYNNEELKNIYEILEKKLAKNADMQKFKEAIKNNPEIVSKLVDYDNLRKEVVVGYFQRCQEEFLDVCNLYEQKKEELEKIVLQANSYTDRWRSIIDLFNARFFVPFEAKVSNVSDVVLNRETAALSFIYQDEVGEKPKVLDDAKYIKYLSQGELRAYNIMQNLFVVEGLKEDGEEHLLILDDIADSFDFKNKYAILEYINDILQTGMFKLIILTHNFDFYRTAVSRLKIKEIYFAYKRNGSRAIELGQGIFKQDILKNRIINRVLVDDNAFIAIIPFARNIVEYTLGTSSEEYKTLTSCLHDKPNTNSLTRGDIFNVIKNTLYDLKDKTIDNPKKTYVELLNQAVDNAIEDDNEIEITNKLVLSIFIRIHAERYMRTVLTDQQLKELEGKNDLTGRLTGVFKKNYSTSHSKECLILNKVLMLTSENIHLNNFMFEPIVDMPITHLKSLLKEVKEKLKIHGREK